MADHELGMSRTELEREIRWRLIRAPKDPEKLLTFIGDLIAGMIATNNAALAARLAPSDDADPAEDF